MLKSELPQSGQRLVGLMQTIQFGRVFYLELINGEIKFLSETERVDDFKLGGSRQSRTIMPDSDFELKKEIVDFFQGLQELRNGFIEVIEIKRGLPDIFRVRRKVA